MSDSSPLPGSGDSTSFSPMSAAVVVLANVVAFVAIWGYFARGGLSELLYWYQEGGWMMHVITLVAMAQLGWNIVVGLVGMRIENVGALHLLPAALAAGLGVVGCALGLYEGHAAIASAPRDSWIPLWSAVLSLVEIPREFGYVVAAMGMVGMVAGPAATAMVTTEPQKRLESLLGSAVGALLGAGAFMYAIARGRAGAAWEMLRATDELPPSSLIAEVVANETQWIQIASLLIGAALIVIVLLGLKRPIFGGLMLLLVLGVVGADTWVDSNREGSAMAAVNEMMPPVPAGFLTAKSESALLAEIGAPWIVFSDDRLMVRGELITGLYSKAGLETLNRELGTGDTADHGYGEPRIRAVKVCGDTTWGVFNLVLPAASDLKEVTKLLMWLREGGACRVNLVVSSHRRPHQPPIFESEHPLVMIAAASKGGFQRIPFRVPRTARAAPHRPPLDLTLTVEGRQVMISGKGGDLPSIEAPESTYLDAVGTKIREIKRTFPEESSVSLIATSGTLQDVVDLLDRVRGTEDEVLFDDIVWGDGPSVRAAQGIYPAAISKGGLGVLGAPDSVRDAIEELLNPAKTPTKTRTKALAEVPPKTSIGTTVAPTTERLDKAGIIRGIRRHITAFRYCYERGLRKSPELAGKVVLEFTVTAAGKTVGTEISSSSLNDSEVEKCILSKAKRMRFPAHDDEAGITVSYPLVFKSN